MTTPWFAVIILVLLSGAVLVHWRVIAVGHGRRINRLQLRVHVNGIRGKSSVTRLIAGVLREGGFVTVAKTTGSAARVIDTRGHEIPIQRRGAATINEQVDVVRDRVGPEVEALVIECMAVRPLYQAYSQDFMVRSDVTVITNVRHDHQEEMGETLEEIADSMAATTPRGGVLVTAEGRPHLRARLERHARDRGSRCVYADPRMVLDEDLSGFDHLEFKENVAIALAVASLVGIDRATALRGMWKSVPDVGALRLRSFDVRGKRLLWVPMFASNDRESVVGNLELLSAYFPPGATRIGLLNNRVDRGRRAELFASMVPNDLAHHLDHVVTLGALEAAVTSTMVEGGYPAARIHNLGDSRRPTLEELVGALADLVEGPNGVLIGLVNIHTAQAEMLLEHLATLDGGRERDGIDISRDVERLPATVHRQRRAGGHPARSDVGA